MLIPLDYAPSTCLQSATIERLHPDARAALLELCILTADLLATFVIRVGGRPFQN
jgi:hypothetical protein